MRRGGKRRASGNRRASGPELLERRYRRLLACYPRAFRRENEEEILTVLLECAQAGQRRPGPAASADLIAGAIRMRLRPDPCSPRAARAAAGLAGATVAANLAVLITVIVTAPSVRSAVARAYPGQAAAQHALSVSLAADCAGGAAGICVLLLLTWALLRRRGWARAAVLIYLIAISVSLLTALAQHAASYAPADLIAGAAAWVLALAAAALLFTGACARYYRPQPRAAARWHGTFGTM
jgi:hypothetical protein